MRISYELNWTLLQINIPLIFPWFKITKIKPEIRKVMVKVPVSTPEPVQEQTPKAIDYPDTVNYPKVRKSPVYYLDKAKFRHTGHMAGTEVYQLHDIRQDLIKFFVDNDNKALRLKAIMEHKASPFRHPFVKCDPDCTDRIASEASIRKALNNATYLIEDLEKMFGTETLFVMEELGKIAWQQSGIRAGQTTSFNGWRLSDEAYFIQLNKLGLADYIQEEPEELTKELDEKIVITTTKKEIPAWRKEAIDRMT
jgi:hypothetical protein